MFTKKFIIALCLSCAYIFAFAILMLFINHQSAREAICYLNGVVLGTLLGYIRRGKDE